MGLLVLFGLQWVGLLSARSFLKILCDHTRPQDVALVMNLIPATSLALSALVMALVVHAATFSNATIMSDGLHTSIDGGACGSIGAKSSLPITQFIMQTQSSSTSAPRSQSCASDICVRIAAMPSGQEIASVFPLCRVQVLARRKSPGIPAGEECKEALLNVEDDVCQSILADDTCGIVEG